MTLRVDTMGAGPDLVMLHGWSLHCGVFDGIADALAEQFTVHFIDLPGHGHNAATELPDSIDAVAKMLLEVAPETAHWLGWSIGGMAAMAAAVIAPERIVKLVTVAATPRFVSDRSGAGGDWPHAIPVATLDDMAADLASDYRKTVKDFLSLQVLGDDHARSLLRDLREHLYAHGEPSSASLANGLRLLHDTDLRDAVQGLQQPWLSIMGQRDRLASPQIGEWIASNVTSARNVTIPKAAHAPFISHREEFLAVLQDFLVDEEQQPGVGR